MSLKRVAGVIVFLVGAFLGASTQTDMWDGSHFFVWILILIIALAVCGAGVGLWRSGNPKTKEHSSDIERVTILTQYSIVCQAPGAKPYTVCAYSGTDLSQVLGITQAESMPADSYGWILECGDAVVRVSGQTHPAYADFRPNVAKRHLSEESSKGSQKRPAKLPSGSMDEMPFPHHKDKRLSQLPPLLIEVGPYCKLLRDARDLFVDGQFYACIIMCGTSLEKFQRDKAKPYGAKRKHKMPQVRSMLKSVLKSGTLTLCKSMADLRNEYAHGHGLKPKEDALKAIKWTHFFIDKETNLMRDYIIVDGILSRKRTEEGD
jgi:hypothetical protein